MVAVAAVNVTDPPLQTVVGPLGVIFDDGNGFTVTTVGVELAEQPFALVTVTL